MGITGEASGAIRVGLVDRHPLVRERTRLMIESSGIEVIAEASSAREAADLFADLEPHVVLMDLHPSELGEIEWVRRMNEAMPATAVIIVSSFQSADYLTRAVRAGASGYLAKSASRGLLADSIRVAAQGGSVIDREVLNLLVSERSGSEPLSGVLNGLTDRELAVLKLLAAGRSNTEIAEALGTSVGTVKNAVRQVFEQFSVSDRVQAAVMAVRAGLDVD